MLRLFKSDYLILMAVVVLAMYMAYIPKLDYPYPVHIDDWVHIAHANAMLQAADIFYPDPFSGQTTGGVVALLEGGFHVLFGVFYRISGISWIDLSRYFPSIIFAIAVLSVYIMAKREGFGWEAAFFTCLIPTTIGILGPAFLVPVNMALIYIPLSLFLVFNFRNFTSYLLLFVFTCFLIITHATSAVCLILIIVPCILLYLKNEPKHGFMLALVWGIPFLLTLPWTNGLIVSTAQSLFVQQPLPAYHDLPHIIKTYGYVPVGIGLLGTFWMALKGGVKNYSLLFGLLILLAMLAVFYTLHYGVAPMYLRGILYAMLMLSMVAGAGLKAVKDIKLPGKLGLPDGLKKVGYVLCLGLVVITLVIGIPRRYDISYYHMIDQEDYEAFIWIRDNLDGRYQLAILDPWKATPFSALTGKYVYARTHVSPTEKDARANAFLEEGCMDTDFLKRVGITIVYNREACSNPDLIEVREHVFLLSGQ